MTEQRTGWRKSSYSSGGSDNCVEVAIGRVDVGVRDTKDRAAGHIDAPAASWRALLAQVS